MKNFNSDQNWQSALYLRIASILRSRIYGGEFRSGASLPPLPHLVSEFGVARGTVRQAIQMLAGEGLVNCARGRTAIVTYTPERIQKSRISIEIEKHLEVAPDLRIDVLRRELVSELPPDRVNHGTPLSEYLRVDKVHSEEGRPFCRVSIYIDPVLYDRFPPASDEREKIIKLLQDHGGVPIVEIQERICVGFADLRTAEILNCSLADPVAEVHHAVLNPTGKIMCYAAAVYLGAKFVIERNITDLIGAQ